MKNKIKNILFFLLPIIILLIIQQAFYPAIMSYDSLIQWNQVQSGKIDNAHPFLTTFVMRLLSKIWNNPGIVVIFHILVFSTMWGIICIYLNKNNYKKNYIFTILLCLFPIIYLYALTIWKDILYSYFLLFISFLLFKGADRKYNYSAYEIITLGIMMALTVLYRHNGIIVIGLLLPLLLFRLIKNKINIKKIIVLLLTIIATYQTLNIPKNLYLYEGDTERIDAGLNTIDCYAVFILSTYYNNNAIKDKNDLEIMHNITTKDIWTTYYDPYLINTLLFREEINTEYILKNKKEVYNLLIKYIIKKPQYLVKHYLLADSMLYNPLPFGALYVFEFSEWNPNYGFYGNTKTHIPWLRDILTYEVRLTYGYPYILRVLMYRPVYPLALSIILLIILYKKKKINKEHFMVLTPMIFNTCSLLPINLAQDVRYVYINFLTFFFILFIYINRKGEKEKKEDIKLARNLNVDLIKFTACFFVIAVHSLIRTGYYEININNTTAYVFTMMRSLFINCVPLFITTTGYLMCQKELNKKYYKGILKTLVLTILIGTILLLICDNLTVNKFIENLINFNGAPYAWYVRMYLGLFLLIPFLNIIVKNINKKQLFIFIISLNFLCTIPSILLNDGKPIINSWWISIYPLTYYFIGSYIKKYGFKIKKNSSLVLFIVFLLINGFINIYVAHAGPFKDSGLNGYNSTFILFTTLYLFLWLLQVNVNKLPNIFKWIIIKTSKNSLPLYLISYFFDNIFYELIKPYLDNKYLYSFTGIILVFISSFISAYLLDIIYDKTLKKPIGFIYDKTINVGNKILDRILLITT